MNIIQAEEAAITAATTMEKPLFSFWPTQMKLPHCIHSICAFKGIGKRKNHLFLLMLSHLTSHPLETEPHTSSSGRHHRCTACPSPAACLLSEGNGIVASVPGGGASEQTCCDTSVGQDSNHLGEGQSLTGARCSRGAAGDRNACRS